LGWVIEAPAGLHIEVRDVELTMRTLRHGPAVNACHGGPLRGLDGLDGHRLPWLGLLQSVVSALTILLLPLLPELQLLALLELLVLPKGLELLLRPLLLSLLKD